MIRRNHLIGWMLVVGETSACELAAKTEAGLQCFVGDYGKNQKIVACDHVAFGLWKPDTPLPMTSWSFYESADYLCFVEGVFYGDYHGHEPIGGEDPKVAELLVRQYVNDKNDAIAALNGCFSGFLFHRQSSTLATFVDKLGVRVLYWSWEKDNLVVSSNLASFRHLRSLDLDREAAFQFLTVGFPIGERTLLKNISIQLPCTINIFKAGSKESACYWNPKRAKALELEETVVSIVSSMEDFVNRLHKRTDGKTVALGLTGGHDSRVIAASLASQQLPFQAFRWRESNFNEEVVRHLCSLMNVPLHIVKAYSAGEIKGMKENVFTYSDGSTSEGWNFAGLGRHCAEHEIQHLLLGFAGGPVSGSLTIPEPEHFDNIADLARCELKSQMEILSFEQAQALLIGSAADCVERAKAEWNSSFAAEEGRDTFSDILIWQRLANRNLKRIRNGMIPASQYTQLIFPYLDNEVLEAYFNAPVEHIKYQKAHCYTGFYRFKEFGDYRTTGFPVPLKWEAQSPFSLYSFRIFRDALQNLRSLVKDSHSAGENETVREYMKRLSTCPLFDGKRVQKLLSENRISRKSVYKMHNLAKFFDTYVGS
jgi:Glutamine amidotransferase domain